MKKDKDKDIINEGSINDLIRYAENDGDNTSESERELDGGTPPMDIPDTGGIEYGGAYNDIYDEAFDRTDGAFGNEPKNTKKGVIVGGIIGLIVVLLFISIDSGIIGKYKNNFTKNFSNIFSSLKSADNSLPEAPATPKPDAVYSTEITSNVIIPLENASDTEFAPYKGGILCANMNHLSYIDSSGSVAWEQDTVIVDPILKAEGNYILLAERGRNKICLYNDKKLVYETEDPDIIESANVSSNGDAVIITDKASYKGGISVYNKSGAQIFSWASGSDSVISADISSSSRRVAVALLNTDANAKSAIQLFNVNKTNSYAKVDADDTVIFEVTFADDTLNAFGDNRILGVSSSGRVIYDNTFENVQLTHSAVDDDGSKLLSFDDGNIPMLNLYSPGGSLKDSVTLTGVTDFIGVSNKNALYNIGRDVYFGKLNSKNMTKYTATMDIRNLYVLSDVSFAIVYSNSIELVTI